ncbi:glycosyltransferase family protein [Phaeobacter sp. 22II1-1F12B]|uniref:glycosyltransferase family protein n=1 Tax=Phaeobacter sp. 22II1-1F12B TaxID=1317111 RepID=UPI000B51F210|nr:glycosyltransferase [Phaeobacter sp. 22II1-1F12B]OWU81037.1 glycosyltransferase [Phaeobacter sp. 22II1-1F12B]
MKVMIVVTHLLGSGHLARAMVLGEAFHAAGHEVTVVSGGGAIERLQRPGVSLLQLPPLRSDGTNFTRLLDDTGKEADEAYLAARRTSLVKAVGDVAPDILITELFPFGRRVLRAEFLELLGATRNMAQPPVILSSIRDILAPPSKPDRAAKTDEIIDWFYDGVLVHSDPETTPLDASWPVSDNLRTRLHYTGYVAPAPAGDHPEEAGHGEVLVSAGGGGVGGALFDAAIGAARLLPSYRWRLLVGGEDATDTIACLQGNAPDNAVIEPARPDFRQMLRHAAGSVSMCGYNTALDLMQAATPSVLVPFDAGKETEQSLRAEALARLPGFEVLKSAELTPERLANAVTEVIAAPKRSASHSRFDGAARSVEIACAMAEARQ